MHISLIYNVENSGLTNNPGFYYGRRTPAKPVYLQDTHEQRNIFNKSGRS
jgi:hypothetical protein